MREWLLAASRGIDSSIKVHQGGTYVYDLSTGDFLRVSEAVSSWGLGGPTGNAEQFMWHTPVNHRKGATQHLGELLD